MYKERQTRQSTATQTKCFRKQIKIKKNKTTINNNKRTNVPMCFRNGCLLRQCCMFCIHKIFQQWSFTNFSFPMFSRGNCMNSWFDRSFRHFFDCRIKCHTIMNEWWFKRSTCWCMVCKCTTSQERGAGGSVGCRCCCAETSDVETKHDSWILL